MSQLRLIVVGFLVGALLACNPFVDLRPSFSSGDEDQGGEAEFEHLIDIEQEYEGDSEPTDLEEDADLAETDGLDVEQPDLPDSGDIDRDRPDVEIDRDTPQFVPLPYDGRRLLVGSRFDYYYLYDVIKVGSERVSRVRIYKDSLLESSLVQELPADNLSAFRFQPPKYSAGAVRNKYFFDPFLPIIVDDLQTVPTVHTAVVRLESQRTQTAALVELPFADIDDDRLLYVGVAPDSGTDNQLRVLAIAANLDHQGKLNVYRCSAQVLSSDRLGAPNCLPSPMELDVGEARVDSVLDGSARITSVTFEQTFLLALDTFVLRLNSEGRLMTLGMLTPPVGQVDLVRLLDIAVDSTEEHAAVAFFVEDRDGARPFLCLYDVNESGAGNVSFTLRSCASADGVDADELVLFWAEDTASGDLAFAVSPNPSRPSVIMARLEVLASNDDYRIQRRVPCYGGAVVDTYGTFWCPNAETDGKVVRVELYSASLPQFFDNAELLPQYRGKR